jgi:cyclase
MTRHFVALCSIALACGTAANAQTPPGSNLCTTSVQLPQPDGARGGGPGGAGGGRGAQAAQAPAPPAELPRLVKIKEDVYLIQNVNNTVAEIGPFGGNVTIYLTNEGVILFDSKNDRMHDDVVARVRSLTDKPIKYVVLTHNHGDHAGGSAKMQGIGATVIISAEDREQLAKANQPVLPQLAYHGEAGIFLGGKEVRLREFCGHTRGDTVALLPGPRVLIAGDLVTTPDTIPQIVNYGDGGNWTDMGKTLDELAKMDFDAMVGGHGPVLTKDDFLKHRDKVAAIRERLRVLNRQGRSQEEITQSLLSEFNYGTGPGAGQIAPMMRELK